MALTEAQLAKIARIKDLKTLTTKVKTLFSSTVSSVDLAKDTTAVDGYAASYTLSVNGTPLSTKINIPKDFLVKSATLATVSTADTPYSGAAIGDKYIDFVINSKDASDGTGAEHIYLPVSDLVNTYTAGNGLSLSSGAFSVAIDSSNANGLSVGASGVALATVTASTSGTGGSNGAMLATDKEKLNGISTQANKVTVTTEKAGTIEIDGVSKVIVDIATDSDVTAMMDEVFPSSSGGGTGE